MWCSLRQKRCSAFALRVGGISVLLSLSWPAQAFPLDDNRHLGVATCASSVCHGRATPSESSPIAQNEYRIWSKYDPHARAYQTLHNVDSQRIAANMGLPEASTAPECLACHSDNSPEEKRGDRFVLSDGVGCEVCHGGSEQWIDAHYGAAASHANNLELGLFKTEDPSVLAEICQSCHLGEDNKYASHQMMAAGHPRLRFELDTWLALLPAHHQVDQDYQQRKGQVRGVDRWLAGTFQGAALYLDHLSQHAAKQQFIPELAVFDCHSCHRPMNTRRQRSKDEPVSTVGSLRINDSGLQLVQVFAGLRDRGLAEQLAAQLAKLQQSTQRDKNAFLAKVTAVKASNTKIHQLFKKQALKESEAQQLSQLLLRRAAQGQFRDYADAEQLFLGLQVLEVELQDSSRTRYDRLFRLLDDEQRFNAEQIRREASTLLAQ